MCVSLDEELDKYFILGDDRFFRHEGLAPGGSFAKMGEASGRQSPNECQSNFLITDIYYIYINLSY